MKTKETKFSKLRLTGLIAALFLMHGLSNSSAQTVSKLDLSGTWKVTWNDGVHGSYSKDNFFSFHGPNDSLRYLDVPVPMDLNEAMIRKGYSADVNIGLNSMRSRWVGQQLWQYYRTFNAPAESASAQAWLVFERLDLNAVIYLNDQLVGKSNNAHMPWRFPVKVKPGSNLITVGIESGIYGVADKEGIAYCDEIPTLLNKRHWQRKPQYQFGWDWSAPLTNVGISGPVRLEWSTKPRIDQLVTWVKMSDDLATAELTVRPFIDCTADSMEVNIETSIEGTEYKTKKNVTIYKGIHPYPAVIKISKPQLWWPVGHGAQKLYTINTTVSVNGKAADMASRKTGFRKIEIDRSVHPVEGNYFIIKVNNRPVFCKGGNWVPADLIYSNIDKERLVKLTDLALAANFNILRVWGGGLYAGNELFSICDEKGLLVWHDNLFACAKYPGDNVEFYTNVEKEITWTVREFAHHPSLIVWCGNNELEWAAFGWGYKDKGKVIPDYIIYHHMIPVIMKAEDPYRFYWPSSPYSENYEFPNSKTTGDQHPWADWGTMGFFDPHIYRTYVDRFPNEGGVLGASSPATLRQFLPAGEQYIRSLSWEHHDNPLGCWSPDGTSLAYETVKRFAGLDYLKLSIDDYVLISGLCQSEGLMEYINNFRRRMYSSSSAIFWMYNDSWPVTHGWTIVDYYFRKKIAFHPVRRAFQPVTVVVADEDSIINVYGVNDSPDDWKGTVRYGIFETHGKLPLDKKQEVSLPALKSSLLASIDRNMIVKAGINKTAAFAVLSTAEKTIAQHKLFLTRMKDVEFDKSSVGIQYIGNKAVFTSPVYVWGVCIDLNGESKVSDNSFDLLPGIPYSIDIAKGEKIKVIKTGNDLLKK